MMVVEENDPLLMKYFTDHACKRGERGEGSRIDDHVAYKRGETGEGSRTDDHIAYKRGEMGKCSRIFEYDPFSHPE